MMASRRTLATTMIGAAAICATSLISAGTAHAADTAPECGAWSLSYGRTVYSGLSFYQDDGVRAAGFSTELTFMNFLDDDQVAFTGARAVWLWDSANSADSETYEPAYMHREDNGTWLARGVIKESKVVGTPPSSEVDVTVTPHCSADRNVESISVTVTPKSQAERSLVAELTRR